MYVPSFFRTWYLQDPKVAAERDALKAEVDALKSQTVTLDTRDGGVPRDHSEGLIRNLRQA